MIAAFCSDDMRRHCSICSRSIFHDVSELRGVGGTADYTGDEPQARVSMYVVPFRLRQATAGLAVARRSLASGGDRRTS